MIAFGACHFCSCPLECKKREALREKEREHLEAMQQINVHLEHLLKARNANCAAS